MTIWQSNSMFMMLYTHFANLQQQIRIVLPVVTNNKATNTEEKDTAAEALSYSLGQIYLELDRILIHSLDISL